MSALASDTNELKPGSATAEGTLRFAARFQNQTAPGNYREIRGGLVLSSIGIGTYLGEPDARTDAAYTAAVVEAVSDGINVIDTAINYRLQRSERSVGAALKELYGKGFSRDEVMICTKAGFLTPDGKMPADPNTYFSEEFFGEGDFPRGRYRGGLPLHGAGISGGPAGPEPEKNIGVQTIDVFYLHNPETQLSEVPRPEFLARDARGVFCFWSRR